MGFSLQLYNGQAILNDWCPLQEDGQQAFAPSPHKRKEKQDDGQYEEKQSVVDQQVM